MFIQNNKQLNNNPFGETVHSASISQLLWIIYLIVNSLPMSIRLQILQTAATVVT